MKFAGEVLVVFYNFTNCIQPAQSGEMHVVQRLVDLHHPVLDSCLYSIRHLFGYHSDQLWIYDCSGHRFIFLSDPACVVAGDPPAAFDLLLPLADESPATTQPPLLALRLSLSLQVIHQVLLVLGDHIVQLGFLVGSENLVKLGRNTRSLHREFSHV
jgi:hypothetical protein